MIDIASWDVCTSTNTCARIHLPEYTYEDAKTVAGEKLGKATELNVLSGDKGWWRRVTGENRAFSVYDYVFKVELRRVRMSVLLLFFMVIFVELMILIRRSTCKLCITV